MESAHRWDPEVVFGARFLELHLACHANDYLQIGSSADTCLSRLMEQLEMVVASKLTILYIISEISYPWRMCPIERYNVTQWKAITDIINSKSIPDEEVEQDPKHTVKGYSSKPIGVPLCAVAISRAFCINAKAEATSESRNHKKKRKSVSAKVNVFVAQDLAASEDEEISDLAFLFSDSEEAGAKDKKENKKVNLPPMTDFEPGTLDQSKLPMLDPPSYATPGTTKGLNRYVILSHPVLHSLRGRAGRT